MLSLGVVEDFLVVVGIAVVVVVVERIVVVVVVGMVNSYQVGR